MAGLKKLTYLRVDRREFTHALRTTVAAMASFLVARWFGLPESYWASVSTLIVMQSTVGAAWAVSKDRLAGTALGAAAGGILATDAAENVALFGVGLFALGVLCAILRLRRSAYRYAGITLAIVMLIVRTQPAWIIAFHRFIEISVGIAIGLIVTALWPESEAQFAAGRASER
ncbi:MAG: FUSC family protein [Polyangia bacterium]